MEMELMREVTLILPEREVQKIIKKLVNMRVVQTMETSFAILSVTGLNPTQDEIKNSKMNFLYEKIMGDPELKKDFFRVASSMAMSMIIEDPAMILQGIEHLSKEDENTVNPMQDLIQKLINKGVN